MPTKGMLTMLSGAARGDSIALLLSSISWQYVDWRYRSASKALVAMALCFMNRFFYLHYARTHTSWHGHSAMLWSVLAGWACFFNRISLRDASDRRL